MPIEKYLSVFVKNKVGCLSDLATALEEAAIGIRAMSTVDDVDWAIVGLIVDDIEKAKKTLTDRGWNFGESTVLAIEVANKPGTLADIVGKLAEHNINIVHTFATAAGDRSLVVLMTTDNKKAAEILG